MMFLIELIASSFLDLISKQARRECRCKRVLVTDNQDELWYPLTTKKTPCIRSPFQNCEIKISHYTLHSRFSLINYNSDWDT